MRVLFLIPHPEEAPSGRYRVFQYVPWLTRHGVEAQIRPFMSRTLYRILYQPGRLPQKIALSAAALGKRLTDVVRAARADVVVIHREALPLGTAVLERTIARLCPRVVFDFDDAIYLSHASHANSWTRAFRRAEKTAEIIRASAEVIAGNDELAAYARQFHPRVHVIPTPVDTERYRPGGARARTPVVIGWIGSFTTVNYLAMLQEPLAILKRRYPDVEIRIVGAGHVPLRLANLHRVTWSLEGEIEQLHRFDIGVMPMPDDPWTRGKCGFKALLYMSVGIPVVASPIGINREIVQDGLSGYLATTAGEWVERLSRLIEDESLRRRMGETGREIVERDYSVSANAPRFLDILQGAEAAAPAPASVQITHDKPAAV